ncbi:hypothetical protein DGMP_11660 [Desulfomarina profundi]|uniref:Uncharacterized protein n=1 Tax=Desulfomarina profundi TaxID=2772557 RepID=A0A8D5FK65_9BACT|nr:hypothetical protein [Desulfomarina profundi]BCL60473.1 hypothetical protein DGMP_11660 [Desulfomarina profundi]
MKRIQTAFTPTGQFVYGIHKPSFFVKNLRDTTAISTLGMDENNLPVDNGQNYPDDDFEVEKSDWIFEIPNAFFFRGRTYIDKEWADRSAENLDRIKIDLPEKVSFTDLVATSGAKADLLEKLPAPLLYALATCSTDPKDLVRLARLSCEIIVDERENPVGLRYRKEAANISRPVIHNHDLFEAVANNPALPDEYKIVMVIRPGAQGGSEIVGEWPKGKEDSSGAGSHVFEYLRRNSYIPWGHYAANMADDAIRYCIRDLGSEDITGLRHLYYQRSFVRIAHALALASHNTRRKLNKEQLEELRKEIIHHPDFPTLGVSTLWGWNFGFDFAPSGYRLHASHQQIHQQYAMIPDTVPAYSGSTEKSVGELSCYSCGDLVADCIREYRKEYGSEFFRDYEKAIAGNKRMDDRPDLEADLVIWQDKNVMLFVPKAQTSQWEMQLMTLPDRNGRVAGNIFEADTATRNSLDSGILTAQKILAALGARMVTTIEFPKRCDQDSKELYQPLLYSFLPRLPQSPGAFSEAQYRFINGHYPEDFAARCRIITSSL